MHNKFKQLPFFFTPDGAGTGGGAGDGSGGAGSGGGAGHQKSSDFDISSIPENVRKAIEDEGYTKGVGVGKGRAEKEFKKNVTAEVGELLKAKGIEEADLDKLAENYKQSSKISSILEHFSVDSVDSLISTLDEKRRSEMSELEKFKDDNVKLAKSLKDKERELLTSKNNLVSEKDIFVKKEQELLKKVGNVFGISALQTAAINMNVFDPSDVVERLKDRVITEEEGDSFKTYVVDESSNKVVGPGNKPMSVDELVSTFLSGKPHLVKSNAVAGQGSRKSAVVNTVASIGADSKKKEPNAGEDIEFTKEDLKDPKIFSLHMDKIIEGVKSGKIKLS